MKMALAVRGHRVPLSKLIRQLRTTEKAGTTRRNMARVARFYGLRAEAHCDSSLAEIGRLTGRGGDGHRRIYPARLRGRPLRRVRRFFARPHPAARPDPRSVLFTRKKGVPEKVVRTAFDRPQALAPGHRAGRPSVTEPRSAVARRFLFSAAPLRAKKRKALAAARARVRRRGPARSPVRSFFRREAGLSAGAGSGP